MPMQVNQAAEPLYIVKPFSGKGIAASSRPTPRSRSASNASARCGRASAVALTVAILSEVKPIQI